MPVGVGYSKEGQTCFPTVVAHKEDVGTQLLLLLPGSVMILYLASYLFINSAVCSRHAFPTNPNTAHSLAARNFSCLFFASSLIQELS